MEISKKNKSFIIISTIIFIVIYYTGKLFLEKGNSHQINTLTNIDDLAGRWVTEESDGENFILIFREDSVLVNVLPDETRTLGYQLTSDRLKLFDEDEKLLFDWKIQFKKNILLVMQGSDELIFYRE